VRGTVGDNPRSEAGAEHRAREFRRDRFAGTRHVPCSCERQESAGVEFELATPDAAGTALACAGRLCHVAAFALAGEDMTLHGIE
jgi:hypothetical protein